MEAYPVTRIKSYISPYSTRNTPALVICTLNERLNISAHDYIKWSFFDEDNNPIDPFTDWGFQGSCYGIAGTRIRAECVHIKVGWRFARRYTTGWMMVPSASNAPPVINNPTERIRVTEPGTVIINPRINGDGKYAIEIKAPWCRIIGGECGGFGGISLQDRADNTLIHGFKTTGTTNYGISLHTTERIYRALTVDCDIGVSTDECGLRSTGLIDYWTIINSKFRNAHKKQGIRFTGQGNRFLHVHKCDLRDGGCAMGQMSPPNKPGYVKHVRIDQCTLIGGNSHGHDPTKPGTALIPIYPNTSDLVICSNKIVNDTQNPAIVIAPLADGADDGTGAWPSSRQTIAHNNIDTGPLSTRGIKNVAEWEGSVIENSLIDGDPDNPTGKRTDGVWLDYYGNFIRKRRAIAGMHQPHTRRAPRGVRVLGSLT